LVGLSEGIENKQEWSVRGDKYQVASIKWVEKLFTFYFLLFLLTVPQPNVTPAGVG
jgi:hypothetical protein